MIRFVILGALMFLGGCALTIERGPQPQGFSQGFQQGFYKHTCGPKGRDENGCIK